MQDEKTARLTVVPRYRVVPIAPALQVAHGISNGVIVGEAAVDGWTQAVLVREDRVQGLGTLGGTFSTARAVNRTGDVVGGSLTRGDETHHGFLHSGGTMRDLNDLVDRRDGWEILQALDIDDDGRIVALASRNGIDQAVLLQPRVDECTPS